MSGICGLFNIDSAPVAEAELRAMTAMLEKRGPDRTNWRLDEHVGLGHTLLGTTPELLFERQPFEHPETGCVITADVRLDNRDELLSALGLSDRARTTGDAELILLAYLKWDDACLDQLMGDFAFAIHDPRHRKLFCARDQFGMRPFYYHHDRDQGFAFASDARAILVLPQIPYKYNKGRIADFLVAELEWIDYTSTFYDGVYRLPPGHTLTATTSGIQMREYWHPQAGTDIGPLSDSEFREGFLEVFTKAVNSRLRAPAGIVGSMLSGGLDSGSVASIAADSLRAANGGKLRTYSACRNRGVDCPESQAIYAATEMLSVEPTLLQPASLQSAHDALLVGNEEPFDGEFLILKSIYLAARDNGQRVVLDGGAGDMLLDEGSYIVRLIRAGQFSTAYSEIKGMSRYWDDSPIASDLLRQVRAAAIPEPIREIIRPMRQRKASRQYVKASLISRDFANSVDIENRLQQLYDTFPSQWTRSFSEERCRAIRPNVTAGRERYSRLAAGTATEPSDPFLDKRVVEFCATLPVHLRQKDGWPKFMLREVMSARLPDEVVWGRRKPHLGWIFNDAVSRHAMEKRELNLARLQETLAEYVDSAAMTEAWTRFASGKDAELVHSAHILANWLQETVNRPVVPSHGFG